MTAIADHNARRDRIFEGGARRSHAGGRGYSRLVRSLRLLLPLLAAGLLVLAVLWPSLDLRHAVLPDADSLKLDVNDAREVRMRTARLVGEDEQGQPYELSATEARQGDDGINTVLLDHPAGRIALQDGAKLDLEATKGVFDRKAKELDLSGDVTVHHGDGYRFESESASVDIDAGRAVGHQPIHGNGPEGEIQGEGFEILDKGRTVKILGKSRLLITEVPEQK
ncbi:MAG: LPS export ABC transporter periplasmic protein LptC [Alphaproteobacteria bacterium]|nr:LPS export ABC transporter periplasmic protein LptC [Alphaproteobacteria bacterium]